MANRMKQLGLTTALALPLIVSALVSGPFSAPTSAQAGLRMVGPRNPILIDTDGNGVPSAGDARAEPQMSGPTTLILTTRFSCQSQPNNRVDLSQQDAGGRYRTVARRNDFRDQLITVTGSSGNAATNFAFLEVDPRGIQASGNGSFLDMNGDRSMDTITMSGKLSATVNLVFTSDSNYVSIPVSQLGMLNAATSRCGITVTPQIWVPLADTDGDGRGDTVILDLNGDGIPDPQFYWSPRLGALGVPAMSSVGIAVLITLLGSMGVWFIGRYRSADDLS
jgi:hypothetical protein